MSSYRIIASVAAAVACACGSPGQGALVPPSLSGLIDAPYELGVDHDLEDVRDRYEAMEPGEVGRELPPREALRRELADEYARRALSALDSPDWGRPAHEWLLQLLGLWRPAELVPDRALARELGPYAPVARTVRDLHARGGGDLEVVTALLFLALAEPDRRAGHLAEIDEIFAHADELGQAADGQGAEGSRPIQILEAVVEIAPLPDAVDRLLRLYVERHGTIRAAFATDGSKLDLLRAHGDGVFRTTWHIVRVLARAGRIDEAPALIATVEGMGTNGDLREALDAALAPDAAPRAWEDLIDIFADLAAERDTSERAQSRLRAVLALCRDGMRRHPGSADLPMRCADAARRLDLLHLAIRFHEDALARTPESRALTEALAELYRVRVNMLAFYERPNAALRRLVELERFHDEAALRWPHHSPGEEMAGVYAGMGRGLSSLGELTAARAYLERSLALDPTLGALEQLGTIALKQDRFADAITYFERALALHVYGPSEQYDRAKILRLAGDALDGAGRRREARERWAEALRDWESLGSRYELPPGYRGELLVESGKLQWVLGHREEALVSFDAAVDADENGADTHSAVVSFLIVRGEYERALDTFHRALGSAAIDDFSKVYLSLWVLAEARRSGRAPEPLALDYLRTRKGPLWHHALARYATGKMARIALERQATTRGRRAELLYYAAVLGDVDRGRDVRAMLQRVLETDMVMFYEYEMAKHWLREGFAPAPQASR